MWALVAVAAVNTVWSLFYYARVLQAMYLRDPAEGGRLDGARPSLAENALALGLAGPVLALGVFVAPLSRLAAAVADSLPAL
jgi:NADH:ubiquinone oxidoreductase subunit 2 (subunit N)